MTRRFTSPFLLVATLALVACADSTDNDADVTEERDAVTSDAGDVATQDSTATDVADTDVDADTEDTATDDVPTDATVEDVSPTDVADTSDTTDASDAADTTADVPQDVADASDVDAAADVATDADASDGADATDTSEDVADIADTGDVNRCDANPCTATDPLVECWDDSTLSHCNFDATEGCFYRTFEDCSETGRVCQDRFGATCAPAG